MCFYFLIKIEFFSNEKTQITKKFEYAVKVYSRKVNLLNMAALLYIIL